MYLQEEIGEDEEKMKYIEADQIKEIKFRKTNANESEDFERLIQLGASVLSKTAVAVGSTLLSETADEVIKTVRNNIKHQFIEAKHISQRNSQINYNIKKRNLFEATPFFDQQLEEGVIKVNTTIKFEPIIPEVKNQYFIAKQLNILQSVEEDIQNFERKILPLLIETVFPLEINQDEFTIDISKGLILTVSKSSSFLVVDIYFVAAMKQNYKTVYQFYSSPVYKDNRNQLLALNVPKEYAIQDTNKITTTATRCVNKIIYEMEDPFEECELVMKRVPLVEQVLQLRDFFVIQITGKTSKVSVDCNLVPTRLYFTEHDVTVFIISKSCDVRVENQIAMTNIAKQRTSESSYQKVILVYNIENWSVKFTFMQIGVITLSVFVCVLLIILAIVIYWFYKRIYGNIDTRVENTYVDLTGGNDELNPFHETHELQENKQTKSNKTIRAPPSTPNSSFLSNNHTKLATLELVGKELRELAKSSHVHSSTLQNCEICQKLYSTQDDNFFEKRKQLSNRPTKI